MKNESKVQGQDFDRELSSPSQTRIREIVRAMPEETPSLAWRSHLNERLLKEVARKRKLSLAGWVWKPAAGMALASVVALAFVARTPELGPVANSRGVEKAIVNSYIEGTASLAVAGDGVSANEVKEAAVEPSPFELDREDVGATL